MAAAGAGAGASLLRCDPSLNLQQVDRLVCTDNYGQKEFLRVNFGKMARRLSLDFSRAVRPEDFTRQVIEMSFAPIVN